MELVLKQTAGAVLKAKVLEADRGSNSGVTFCVLGDLGQLSDLLSLRDFPSKWEEYQNLQVVLTGMYTSQM